MFKKIIALSLLLMVTLGMSGCGNSGTSDDVVRVGSKDFTESLIVSELYALALEDAGFNVERKFGISSSLVHAAITNDEIDLYPEYTGTGLLSILKMELMTDPQEVYDTVKHEYNNQFQITWLDQSQANDAQGLVIKTDVAQALGIQTISDLQANAGQIRFASQGEFDQRDDGIPALEKAYGPFNFASSKVYDNGIKYQILENDEADLTPAYTTEGQLINTHLFTLLEDDKHVWPPYYLAPIVRNDVLDAKPDIAPILNEISAALDTETITALNAKVDVEKMEYDEVAKDFYDSIK